MKEQPNTSHSHDDPIETLSRQNRAIALPERLRQSNRAAIRAALESYESDETSGVWWHRHITVPVPVAAAVILVIVLQSAWTLFRPASPSLTASMTGCQFRELTKGLPSDSPQTMAGGQARQD